ncbi:hypothetical protein L6452_21431 [Arctium lappa]|uniref:Uncharacterized protein n=1 Tax=Arctium lappa TaxID=4217 RepID=A0ACB9AX97_ARCLA|nr:hypothetical protein L6452_21431 [Arctium lappa]
MCQDRMVLKCDGDGDEVDVEPRSQVFRGTSLKILFLSPLSIITTVISYLFTPLSITIHSGQFFSFLLNNFNPFSFPIELYVSEHKLSMAAGPISFHHNKKL